MLSVLVLTKNEERDLPGCLRSVSFSDDVHVLDSISSDRTADVARSFGARVAERPFDDWSSHQNWAIANLPFRHPFVFQIDADERASPELARGLLEAARAPDDFVAFRVRRRDWFMGRRLGRSQASTGYIRLYRPERMRFERLVNPASLPDGPVGEIAGPLDHFPFSKGIGHWIARHNDYSSLEARQLLIDRKRGTRASLATALFGQEHERQRQRKELFHRLPARPLARFLILYLLKGGFLDGYPGLVYCLLQGFYELMIGLKRRELALGADNALDAGQT